MIKKTKATKIFLLSLAVLVSSQTGLLAQTSIVLPKKYAMKDGLPGQVIQCVTQDKNGFLWIGLASGLCKFDGYKFTTLTKKPDSQNNLGNNQIFDIWEDGLGRLWIGHLKGFDVFDPATENFIFHWTDPTIVVNRFRPANEQELWICTNTGIFIANTKTFLTRKFTQDSLWTKDIIRTKDGSIIIAQADQGIGYYKAEKIFSKETANNSVTTTSLGRNHFTHCLVEDLRGRVWVGTNKGLFQFNPGDSTFTRRDASTFRINNMFLKRDGKILLATVNGIIDFNPETHESKVITSGIYAFSVFQDRQEIIWISTFVGLHRVQPPGKKFKEYLSGDPIGSIVEDRDHTIWIQRSSTVDHTNKIFFRRNAASSDKFEYWKQENSQENFLENPGPQSLFLDNDKNAWLVGTGIMKKLNTNEQPIYKIPIPDNVVPLTTFEDSYKNVWLGGWAGLTKYVPSIQYLETVTSFPRANVHSFKEDVHHNLWIATSRGLVRYRLRTGEWEVFTNNPDDKSSLSNDLVYCVEIDRSGTIWIGTDGGLNEIIKGTENSTPQFTRRQASKSGLPKSGIYCIIDGGDETLWITSGASILHFFPKRNVVRTYDWRHGLSGEVFKSIFLLGGRGTRASDGKIYLATTGGLIVFHPDSLVENKYVPPIAITDFLIQNLSVPVKGSDGDTLVWETPLAQGITHTKEIEISHAQNNFSLEFAALNFVSPEGNRYKYRLEPYETEWIETNAANRIARYTNISPGKYTFRVIGSNDDEVWNEEGVTLSITITPPWWRTAWAYVAYGLIFLAGVWRVHVFQKERTIRHEREKFKEEELEKAKEIDQLKTSFFTNISHEFRTPLTLIKGPIQEIIDQIGNNRNEIDRRKISDRLKLVQHNSDHLLRLINQLLDLAKIESGSKAIVKSKEDINPFFKAIVSSFHSLADQKNISIQTDLPLAHYEALFDKDKLETILINLINNAIKFTPQGGSVTVIARLNINPDILTLIVKDTGIGIPEDQQSKIFERFHKVSETHKDVGTGIGLALVNEIVNLLGGFISVKSKFGEGSEFQVVLPIESIQEVRQVFESEEIVISYQSTDTGNGQPTTDHKLQQGNESKPQILVVEDHRDLRAFIIDCLGDEFHFLEAENGKHGLEVAIHEIPDLIISDVMMPEMDGIAMTSKIKSDVHTSHIPLILLTAKSTEDSKLKGLEKGADDYLTKPFNKHELLLKVRNAINRQLKLRERLRAELMSLVPKMEVLSGDEKFLNDVKSGILKRISDEQLSVESLAEDIGLSRSQLYRKIIALTGLSVTELIRKLRMQKAAQLLEQKWGPIAQVAYEVGISNLSYFSKIFKEEFGVLPSIYPVNQDKLRDATNVS